MPMHNLRQIGDQRYQQMFADETEPSKLDWGQPFVICRDRGTETTAPVVVSFGVHDLDETEMAEQMQRAISIWAAGAAKSKITDVVSIVTRHNLRSSRHLQPIAAVIGGQRMEFSSVSDKFDALVAEWNRLRELGSSADTLVNNAYGQIVAMGWDAVPLLLREVQRESGQWFTALYWITGAIVANQQMRGNHRALRQAWIKWGEENGFIR